MAEDNIDLSVNIDFSKAADQTALINANVLNIVKNLGLAQKALEGVTARQGAAYGMPPVKDRLGVGSPLMQQASTRDLSQNDKLIDAAKKAADQAKEIYAKTFTSLQLTFAKANQAIANTGNLDAVEKIKKFQDAANKAATNLIKLRIEPLTKELTRSYGAGLATGVSSAELGKIRETLNELANLRSAFKANWATKSGRESFISTDNEKRIAIMNNAQTSAVGGSGGTSFAMGKNQIRELVYGYIQAGGTFSGAADLRRKIGISYDNSEVRREVRAAISEAFYAIRQTRMASVQAGESIGLGGKVVSVELSKISTAAFDKAATKLGSAADALTRAADVMVKGSAMAGTSIADALRNIKITSAETGKLSDVAHQAANATGLVASQPGQSVVSTERRVPVESPAQSNFGRVVVDSTARKAEERVLQYVKKHGIVEGLKTIYAAPAGGADLGALLTEGTTRGSGRALVEAQRMAIGSKMSPGSFTGTLDFIKAISSMKVDTTGRRLSVDDAGTISGRSLVNRSAKAYASLGGQLSGMSKALDQTTNVEDMIKLLDTIDPNLTTKLLFKDKKRNEYKFQGKDDIALELGRAAYMNQAASAVGTSLSGFGERIRMTPYGDKISTKELENIRRSANTVVANTTTYMNHMLKVVEAIKKAEQEVFDATNNLERTTVGSSAHATRSAQLSQAEEKLKRARAGFLTLGSEKAGFGELGTNVLGFAGRINELSGSKDRVLATDPELGTFSTKYRDLARTNPKFREMLTRLNQLQGSDAARYQDVGLSKKIGEFQALEVAQADGTEANIKLDRKKQARLLKELKEAEKQGLVIREGALEEYKTSNNETMLRVGAKKVFKTIDQAIADHVRLIEQEFENYAKTSAAPYFDRNLETSQARVMQQVRNISPVLNPDARTGRMFSAGNRPPLRETLAGISPLTAEGLPGKNLALQIEEEIKSNPEFAKGAWVKDYLYRNRAKTVIPQENANLARKALGGYNIAETWNALAAEEEQLTKTLSYAIADIDRKKSSRRDSGRRWEEAVRKRDSAQARLSAVRRAKEDASIALGPKLTQSLIGADGRIANRVNTQGGFDWEESVDYVKHLPFMDNASPAEYNKHLSRIQERLEYLNKRKKSGNISQFEAKELEDMFGTANLKTLGKHSNQWMRVPGVKKQWASLIARNMQGSDDAMIEKVFEFFFGEHRVTGEGAGKAHPAARKLHEMVQAGPSGKRGEIWDLRDSISAKEALLKKTTDPVKIQALNKEIENTRKALKELETDYNTRFNNKGIAPEPMGAPAAAVLADDQQLDRKTRNRARRAAVTGDTINEEFQARKRALLLARTLKAGTDVFGTNLRKKDDTNIASPSSVIENLEERLAMRAIPESERPFSPGYVNLRDREKQTEKMALARITRNLQEKILGPAHVEALALSMATDKDPSGRIALDELRRENEEQRRKKLGLAPTSAGGGDANLPPYLTTTGGPGGDDERPKKQLQHSGRNSGRGVPPLVVPPVGGGGGGDDGGFKWRMWSPGDDNSKFGALMNVLNKIAGNTGETARNTQGGTGGGGGVAAPAMISRQRRIAALNAMNNVWGQEVGNLPGVKKGLLSPSELSLAFLTKYPELYGASSDISTRRINITNKEKEDVLKRGMPGYGLPSIASASAAQGQEEGGGGTGGMREGLITSAMRRGLIWGGTSLVIYQTAGALRGFLDLVIKMDKQLTDLRKTLGGTKEDFNKLGDAAIQVARETGTDTQKVLDATELFSKQFKRPQDLAILSRSASLFSNLSGQDIGASVETITAAIEQYNLSVSQAAKLTDSWAAMAASANVTTKDLGDAFGSVAGPAKEAGLTIDELNAMVATITSSTGKSGKEVGTALKRMFERVSSPENEKKLAKEGIRTRVETANGLEARNFVDIMEDLQKGVKGGNKAWEDMSASQKRHIAVLVAGARQYDAFIALMNNYNKVQELVTTSKYSDGEATTQNARLMDTLAKKISLAKVEIDAMARSVGKVLVPAMGGLVTVVTSLLRLLAEFPKVTLALAGIGGLYGLKGIGDLAIKGVLTQHVAGMEYFKNPTMGKFMSPFMSEAGVYNKAQQNIGFPETSRLSLSAVGRGVAMDVSNKMGVTRFIGGDFGTQATARAAAVESGTAIGTGAMLGRTLAAFATSLASIVGWTIALALAFAGLEKLISMSMPAIKSMFIDSSKELNSDARELLKQGRQEGSARRSYIDNSSAMRMELGSRKTLTNQERAQLSERLTGMVDDAAKINPEVNKFFNRDVFGSIAITSGVEEQLKLFENYLKEVNEKAAWTRLYQASYKVTLSLEDFATKVAQNRIFSKETLAVLPATAQLGTEVGNKISTVGSMSLLLERALVDKVDVTKMSSEELKKYVSSAGVLDINNEKRKAGSWEATIVASATQNLAETADVWQRKMLEERPLKEDKYRRELAATGLRGEELDSKVKELRRKDEEMALSSILRKVYTTTFNEKGDLAAASQAYNVAEHLFKLPQEILDRTPTQGTLADDLGKTRQARARWADVEPTRIDFELNKSLVSTSRNAKVLGMSDVNVIDATWQAYSQALTDLQNNIDKVAGPEEDALFRERAQQLADAKTFREDATKRHKDVASGISAGSLRKTREQADVQNGVVQSLKTSHQAIQEETSERRKMTQTLMETASAIRVFKEATDVAAPALKSSLGGAARTEEAMAASRMQTHTDLDYQDKLIAREQEMQARGGYANTPKGRNRLKELKDQRNEISRRQDKAEKDNNFWNKTIRGIGDNAMSSAANQATNWLFGGIFSSVFGELASGTSGLNPSANLEQIAGNEVTFRKRSLELMEQDGVTQKEQLAKQQELNRKIDAALGKLLGNDYVKGIQSVSTGVSGSGVGLSGVAGAVGAGGVAVGVGGLSSSTSDVGLSEIPVSPEEIAALEKAAKAGDQGAKEALASLKKTKNMGNASLGAALGGAVFGSGIGSTITSAQNKTGMGGMVGGAIGGATGGAMFGTVGMIAGALIGGFIGAMSDEENKPILKDLPEIEEEQTAELKTINKNLNTINETMENLINAPANFVLPVPKGILNNSITAQSAVATPLQAGGLILKSGPAYLHAGESVNSASSASIRSQPMNIANTININGTNKDPKEIAQEVATAIGQTLYMQNQRAGSYRSRF